MKQSLLYVKRTIEIELPDSAVSIRPRDASPLRDFEKEYLKSLASPIGGPSLLSLLKKKNPKSVCVVVNDITRPVPYAKFLPLLLSEIESAGVSHSSVTLLVATGMHRPSTPGEKIEMFGRKTTERYRIVDHRADDPACLCRTGLRTASGTGISVNKAYAEADFRILTGLIEPHFMAGFSGGRKSVCPGIADLATISKFHGHGFLSDPKSTNGVLEGNPCHAESLDTALAVRPDFIVNVAVNGSREIVGLFCGDLEKAHAEGVKFVRSLTEFPAEADADLVITSGGGYPLDSTFYQTVKGMVAALPFLKPDGVVITAAECREGIGSREYRDLLFKYSSDWKKFLEDIASSGVVLKDQWELQMQTRLLERTGRRNLVLCSEGIPGQEQERMQVVPCEKFTDGSAGIEDKVKRTIGYFLEKIRAPKVVVLPEGGYAYGRPANNSSAAAIGSRTS